MIKKQLFMGNGDHSTAECYDLITKLMEAFETLSGIQQIPHCGDSKPIFDRYEVEAEDGKEDIEMIVKEIAMALTGKKIKFLEI